MNYVIRLVGLASGEGSEDAARYLCRLREASGPGGLLSTTRDPGKALAFPSPEAAFDFWRSGAAREFHAVIERG